MTIEQAFEYVKLYCDELYEDIELDDDNAQYYLEEPFWKNEDEIEVDFYSGATKGVLVFKDCDYVIKIPFNGYRSEYYEEDFDDEVEYIHYDFECAANSSNNWDYCLSEVQRYEKAKELGIEASFLKTFYLGDINGYPIYAQEKIDEKAWNYNEELEKSHKHKKAIKYIKKIGGNLEDLLNYKNPVDYTWGVETLRHFGQKYTQKLFSYIKEEYINDLHSSNIGYKNGYPVLMDYAGFYDDN